MDRDVIVVVGPERYESQEHIRRITVDQPFQRFARRRYVLQRTRYKDKIISVFIVDRGTKTIEEVEFLGFKRFSRARHRRCFDNIPIKSDAVSKDMFGQVIMNAASAPEIQDRKMVVFDRKAQS